MQTLKIGIPAPEDAFSMTEFDVVVYHDRELGKVALGQYLKATGMVRRLPSSESVILSIQW